MRTAAILLSLCACSTNYRVQSQDLERVKSGAQIANIKAESGDEIDFSTYSFVYRESGKRLEVKGIESLNRMGSAGQLKGLESLALVPGRDDKAWQRTLLGGGVGLAAGLGIGFAITNRVVLEQAASQGPACATCSPGFVALGSIVSGVLGATAGALIAYFAGAGVGNTRNGVLEFLEPSSQPQP